MIKDLRNLHKEVLELFKVKASEFDGTTCDKIAKNGFNEIVILSGHST